jgi:Protein of unknown function (DUF3102)
MKRKNVRSLDTIAVNIHQLARGNIIDIGDLLLEAKSQCEHGDWLNWLRGEFDWSVDTAERYMRVAALNAKFRSLRNLKLAVTTLYELADHEEAEQGIPEDRLNLPAIIDELAKHASKTRLSPRDARRVIKIGIGRRQYGDHPDATLVQLAELNGWGQAWHEKAVAALLEREPDTDESARLLVDEVVAEQKAEEAEIKDDDAEQEEVESILDGAPPDLPPSITPPEPQKFGADTEWAGGESFAFAVTALLELRTKPVGRFVGRFSPSELREVADFLLAIASGAAPRSAENIRCSPRSASSG